VNDVKRGASVLSKHEMIANVQEVVGVKIDKATVADVAKILGENNVNIEDAIGYGFIDNEKILVLKVDNIETANKVLSKEGFKLY